jgi:hypothetical protein
MIPVLAPFEVCEDLRFRDLVTGQAPVSAPSTAQADYQADQRWGARKGSQHPRDHERSPLKERPGLGPDAPLQERPGLGPLSTTDPALRPWRCQRQAPVSTALSLVAYVRGISIGSA